MIQRADFSDAPARAARFPDRNTWLAMFLTAFALRLAYAWLATGPGSHPYSDPADYDAVAWNLVGGHGFALNGATGPYPTAFVPPLVPWITSLLYRAVGHDYFAAVVMQCVIGACVPLALGLLAGGMFGGQVGRLAGWLATVHPLLVFFSGYLLTETTFCLTLLLALAATAEWVKTPRPGRALGAGLAWGLATLTRPTALLLPLCMAMWAWVPLGLTVAARDRVRQVLLLLLGVALTVGPWTLRNASVFHAFVPVTTGAGGAWYVSNNPEVWATRYRSGAEATSWVTLTATEFRGLSEVEIDRRARAKALAFLGAHVREWPAMALAKLARFWRVTSEGGGTGGWQRPGSPLGAVLRRIDPLAVWSALVLPFALWGIALALRGPRRWFQSLGALVILYFTALSVVFFGALRMRVPVEPLVVMFAAAGVEDVRRRMRTRARGFRVIEGRRAG